MRNIYVSAEPIEILTVAKHFINEALQNLVGRAVFLYPEEKQQSKVWGDTITSNQFWVASQSNNVLTPSPSADNLDTTFILRTTNSEGSINPEGHNGGMTVKCHNIILLMMTNEANFLVYGMAYNKITKVAKLCWVTSTDRKVEIKSLYHNLPLYLFYKLAIMASFFLGDVL